MRWLWSLHIDPSHSILHVYGSSIALAFRPHCSFEELPLLLVGPPDTQVLDPDWMRGDPRDAILLRLEDKEKREIVPHVLVDHVVIEKIASGIQNRFPF